MLTGKGNLQNFFSKPIQYRIPLYQRPYVWEEEKQWQPLWDDIRNVAEDYIERLEKEDSINPHFIGAVVLKQKQTKTSEVEKRLVIDGQQRITTIQVLLKAAIDFLCNHDGVDSATKGALSKLIQNEDISEEETPGEDSKYKLRPSRRDIEAFSIIMKISHPKEIKKLIEKTDEEILKKSRIIEAYEFFYEQTEDWFDVDSLDVFNKRVKALKNTLLKGIELVFIDLDEKDKEQIIFETLNARGTPLLQFDLVKNYLYYRAETNRLNIRDLDEKYWSFFDEKSNAKFWEQTVRQGRLYRPASDVFLHHFLTLRKGGEVEASELFDEYQAVVKEKDSDVEFHMEELITYARIYKKFFESQKGTYEYIFFERLREMDNTTMYPLLFGIFYRLPGPENQITRDSMLRCLESFIVRREICKLTIKNYNNLFIEIYKKLNDRGDFSAKGMDAILKKYDAEINRWPNDDEFKKAWLTMPVYRRLTRSKLRMILKALNNVLHDEKAEGGAIEENKLTIEHIMPQSWEENWPIEVINMREEQKEKAKENRENLIHTIGNLTLTTGALNPALSNAAWKKKKVELRKHCVITMNLLLCQCDTWNEGMISERADELFEAALTIWPYNS